MPDSKSFLLDEDGHCACQSTKPVCNSFSGVTLSERPWIVDKGAGQCTGSSSEVKLYNLYSVSREEQILRCARECAGEKYASFTIPLEGGTSDTNNKGRCYCEQHRSTESSCNFNANDANWQKYDLEMQCTGTTYEHVSSLLCVSICMDQDCEAFSYSGQVCTLCDMTAGARMIEGVTSGFVTSIAKSE